jgi:hypothetical protein
MSEWNECDVYEDKVDLRILEKKVVAKRGVRKKIRLRECGTRLD